MNRRLQTAKTAPAAKLDAPTPAGVPRARPCCSPCCARCAARGCGASLAPNLVPCVDLLTRAATTTRSSSPARTREVTAALAELSNAGAHPDSWGRDERRSQLLEARLLGQARSAQRRRQSRARRRRHRVARRGAGRLVCPCRAARRRWAADGGEFANTVRVFGGALELAFAGSFSMVGRSMTLVFQCRLRVRLFWLLKLPRLDIREGSGIRGILERVRGGAKTATGFKKRPSVYAWCYADERICIAQGSSGSVALWSRAPS